ncbi:hypothetical protein R5R35_000840 [Gryllus longicercus]|uniref:G-protein coupled receptors family 1 profile domain-containing protein n=1 Tax=Gryllus longicercus TaxID=2509291 RepID=A0AAN9Z4L1_9ORTH
MFILVVSIFALCWLPYHGYFIYAYHNQAISTSSYVQHLYLAFYWLAMANAMVNPVIYYWMNSRFRLYFQQIICRCCCLRRRAKTALELPALKGQGPLALGACHSHSELQRSRSGRAHAGLACAGDAGTANFPWRRRTQESHVTLRSLPRGGGGGAGATTPESGGPPAPPPPSQQPPPPQPPPPPPAEPPPRAAALLS